MKHLKFNVLTTITLWLVCVSMHAQNGSGFGIRAGLNYGSTGDYFQSIADNVLSPEDNVGYHIGIFGKIGNRIYLKPELVYTKLKTDYDSDTFDMSKLDMPVLVGLKVLGPVSVFAGPAFQYILDSDFEGLTVDDIENDFSVGLNLGIGVNFNSIGIDLRYERGLSDNEVTILDNNNINVNNRLDLRPEQLILSLSVKF